MTWTRKHIEQLHKSGKIRGFRMEDKKPGTPIIPNEKPKAIVWLDLNLAYWCKERGLTLEKEYRFCERRWRFDYCIPKIMVAIEYEGIFGKGKSRHTTVTGYQGDAEKYNRASSLGWKVFRYTAKNYKTALTQLNTFYEQR